MGRLNRALPATMIDLIRDGVRDAELRARGSAAVFGALVSTAASAQNRGVPESEWATVLFDPRSTLARQAQVNHGRPLSRAKVEKLAHRAWQHAAHWLAERPAPYDRAVIDAHVRAVADWIADPDSPIGDTDRAVLAYAVEVAGQRHTTRPALPRHRIVARTGLGDRAVRNALHRLDRAGLLRLDVRGRAGARGPEVPKERRAKANLYRLPDPERLPIPVPASGSVGPPVQTYRTPSVRTVLDPPQTYRTPAALPAAGTDPEEGSPMITVTRDPDGRLILSAPPDVLERAVAAMQSEGRLVVANEHAPDNVRALHPREPRSA